jgi:hypothetical protein
VKRNSKYEKMIECKRKEKEKEKEEMEQEKEKADS